MTFPRSRPGGMLHVPRLQRLESAMRRHRAGIIGSEMEPRRPSKRVIHDFFVNIVCDLIRDIAPVLPEPVANALTIKMPVRLKHRGGLHFARVVAVVAATVLVT